MVVCAYTQKLPFTLGLYIATELSQLMMEHFPTV